MRWRTLLILALLILAGSGDLSASEPRIKKVLVQILDEKGRNAIHPSLFDRDAYQAYLRKHPKEQSGLRFDVNWSSDRALADRLVLRFELRGLRPLGAKSKHQDFKSLVLEEPVKRHGWFSTWSSIKLVGRPFEDFGEIVAWRASLWDGPNKVAEQRSFLW